MSPGSEVRAPRRRLSLQVALICVDPCGTMPGAVETPRPSPRRRLLALEDLSREAAAKKKKWVRAVNHRGRFRLWDHLGCKAPNALPAKLEKWCETFAARSG